MKVVYWGDVGNSSWEEGKLYRKGKVVYYRYIIWLVFMRRKWSLILL